MSKKMFDNLISEGENFYIPPTVAKCPSMFTVSCKEPTWRPRTRDIEWKRSDCPGDEAVFILTGSVHVWANYVQCLGARG